MRQLTLEDVKKYATAKELEYLLEWGLADKMKKKVKAFIKGIGWKTVASIAGVALTLGIGSDLYTGQHQKYQAAVHDKSHYTTVEYTRDTKGNVTGTRKIDHYIIKLVTGQVKNLESESWQEFDAEISKSAWDKAKIGDRVVVKELEGGWTGIDYFRSITPTGTNQFSSSGKWDK